jgi:hypothetical protein
LPAELPVLGLSEPVVQIGVLDGADEYTFGSVETALRLADGSIAVSDPGAFRISVFDEGGVFLRSWGSEGEGPGEFRQLSRIYRAGADSIYAAERWQGTVSVFDVQGGYARQVPGSDISGDSVFALDSWLYGRFFVEGALTAAERERTRAVLDRLPPPRLDPGYRAVRADREGRLWIREPSGREPGASADDDAARVTWTRLDANGRPEAVVLTPAAFRPTWISGDEMLGEWRGEADVSFVRAYRVIATGDSRAVPAWLAGAESIVTAEAPPNEQELMDAMRGALRSMAMAQEIHYSSAMSYTTSLEDLERFEQPEELTVDFIFGTPRGWGVVFTHPAVDRVCGLVYGFDIPPGWTPGSIVCGPVAGSSTTTDGTEG